jgi:hypothetical protein
MFMEVAEQKSLDCLKSDQNNCQAAQALMDALPQFGPQLSTRHNYMEILADQKPALHKANVSPP